MGRVSSSKRGSLHKRLWTADEDSLLVNCIHAYGDGHWRSLPKRAGLQRSGRSCRLRWINYLRPDIKRGNITAEEEDLIISMHALLGNKWTVIAGRLTGRTDNEIKNYWNTHLSRKLKDQGIDPSTHKSIIHSNSSPQVQKKSTSGEVNNDKVINRDNQFKNDAEIDQRIKINVHIPIPVKIDHISSSNSLSMPISSVNSEWTTASSGLKEAPSAFDYNHGNMFIDEGYWCRLFGNDNYHDNGYGLECKLGKFYEECLQILNNAEGSDESDDHFTRFS